MVVDQQAIEAKVEVTVEQIAVLVQILNKDMAIGNV
jgi:hypothetical protein